MIDSRSPAIPGGLAPADYELYAALGHAQPRFATMPTPGAAHDLAQVRAVARALGTPLMPWQELVARVATEKRPGHPDEYRYKLVVLTVPRQAGKTTVMRTVLTQRALMHTGRRAFYTAQTGKDAAARWGDLVKQIETGPFAGHVTKRMSIGTQALNFPNGSSIAPFAPTPKSLHGYTPHDVFCDEIFAFDAAQGDELMGAIGPAQVTLRSRQIWLVSTMGTRDSTFLHGWVDRGRASITDPQPVGGELDSIAYLEWSMEPGADPYDPASWDFHPALGYTIDTETLAALARQHSPGEWLRAFMNTQSVTNEAVIQPEIVEAAATVQTPPASTHDLAIAFEVAHDRSRTVIWGAWNDPTTGHPAVRLIQSQAGTSWLPEAIAELHASWRPRFIGADRGGAATRDMLDAITNDFPALEIAVLQATDFATACDAFRARMVDGHLSHDGSAGLVDSIQAATTKTLGQGWTWDRVKSRGQIPDLIAATVALRLLERAPAPAPTPKVWSPA